MRSARRLKKMLEKQRQRRKDRRSARTPRPFGRSDDYEQMVKYGVLPMFLSRIDVTKERELSIDLS